MALLTPKQRQYRIAQMLHWVAFVLISFNLLSGWRIDNFEPAIKAILMMVHSSIGSTVLLLMVLRLWWRKRNRLYTPPRWWKRPTLLLQWIFYPLVIIQVLIGMTQAAFVDFPVIAYGVIPFSSLGPEDPALRALFLGMHKWMAWLLILLVIAHGLDRGRIFFKEDAAGLATESRG